MDPKQEKIYINSDKTTYNEFIRARDRKKKLEQRLDTVETLVLALQQQISLLENIIKTKSNGDRV